MEDNDNETKLAKRLDTTVRKLDCEFSDKLRKTAVILIITIIINSCAFVNFLCSCQCINALVAVRMSIKQIFGTI
jgi:hypothetical protein